MASIDSVRRFRLSGPVVVAIVALTVHAVGIFNGYTMDDQRAIWMHPGVGGDGSFVDVFLKEWWGRPLTARDYWSAAYRPITTLTLAVSHRITTAPWLHHTFNVLLFGLPAALTTRIARRWCTERVAISAGLLFAVLPLHVENVASIVGRADVLAALFCLFAFELLGPERPSASRIAFASLLYLCGLLSKESVALFPALILWLGLTAHLHAPGAMSICRRLLPGVVLGVTGFVYLIFRQQILPISMPADFVGAQNMLHGVHGLPRIWGNLGVYGRYAELAFLPYRRGQDGSLYLELER